MLESALQRQLDARRQEGLYRQRDVIDHISSTHIRHKNQTYLSFASNNYLGLAQHPKVIEACRKSFKQGVGSGSAYLVSGYTQAHQQLEECLANFLGFERVLIFSCGYLANMGIIKALYSKHDSIFGDKLNHASLVESCLASKAIFKRYPHGHMHILEQHCTQAAGNKLVVSEGVFGMDGDIAPLPQLVKISQQHQTQLLIDDAHGIGVLGKTGRGSMEIHHLDASKINILSGTFSKAFGSYGGFVAANKVIIESLIQHAKTYLYTTAIPAGLIHATLASLDIIQQEPERRERLTNLIEYLRLGSQQLGLTFLPSQTPIQPLILGCPVKALRVSESLLQQGIFVKAIRPPTVPAGSARIRITLTADHKRTDIDFLLECLIHAIKH